MQVDPAEAAAIAEGADATDADVGDLEAGPADAGDESGPGVLDALLQTEPSTPLDMVESPWNPEQGGAARIYRGIQKMTGMDGMPAIADLLIGVCELIVEQSDGDVGDDVQEAGDEVALPVEQVQGETDVSPSSEGA